MIFQIIEVRRTRHLTKLVRDDLSLEYSTCFMLIVIYLGRSAAGLVLITSYLAVRCDGCCNSRVASAVSEYRGVPFEGFVAVAVTPCLLVAMYDGCLDNLLASIFRVVGEIYYQRFGDNIQSPSAKLHLVTSE
jgi:hypothetical protein